jgi:hypothetical protein
MSCRQLHRQLHDQAGRCHPTSRSAGVITRPPLPAVPMQATGRAYSLAAVDQRVANIYFAFDAANVFMGGVLGGSALQQLNNALCDPSQIMDLIGAAVPSSSNFFFSYVITRALFLTPLRCAGWLAAVRSRV